jgi:hypothetical protein
MPTPERDRNREWDRKETNDAPSEMIHIPEQDELFRDILYEFALACEGPPTEALLGTFLHRHPNHRAEIVDFYLDLVRDSAGQDESIPIPTPPTDQPRPAVQKAMLQFRERLNALKHE